MTREDRAWDALCQRLGRDPATSEEGDTLSLRAAWKFALAFADDEVKRERERCAADSLQQVSDPAQFVARGAQNVPLDERTFYESRIVG